MQIESHTDLLKLADKSRLTINTQGLLSLPETAQDHYNLYSMVNFAPLYSQIIEKIEPTKIVEIGSEAGVNTKEISRLAELVGAEHYIVDTKPTIAQELAQKESTHYVESTSFEFLDGFKGADVYFIDGDHNYVTLLGELERIHAIKWDRPLIMFLHDTSWPYGRRDFYYDLATVSEVPNEVSFEGGPTMWGRKLEPNGHFSSGKSFANAIDEGGSRNGLMTAVEDFLQGKKEYESFHIPAFYGLSILWNAKNMEPAHKKMMSSIKRTYKSVAPILGTLEWNRLVHIFLHEKYFRTINEKKRIGRKVDEMQAAMNAKDENLAVAKADVAKLKAELEKNNSSELEKLKGDYITLQEQFIEEQRKHAAALEESINEVAKMRLAHETAVEALTKKIELLKQLVFEQTCAKSAQHEASAEGATTYQEQARMKYLEQEVNRLSNSRSWRMTRPLRDVAQFVRKHKNS